MTAEIIDSSHPKQAAYGTWSSSLTGKFVAGHSVRLAEPRWQSGLLWWLETRPEQKGRQTLMRLQADGHIAEALPAPWNARTKIHEYGGGSYTTSTQHVYFVNGDDQQIYRFPISHADTNDEFVAEAITQQPSCRFGDLHYSDIHQCLIAVCEDHSDPSTEPKNTLVSITLDGKMTVVDASHDFVTSASLSPDGRWLAYISWEHPNMPWQATQLWIREFHSATDVGPAIEVAGTPVSNHLPQVSLENTGVSETQSITQPRWAPNGDLYWISDFSGWWNLYSTKATGLPSIQPVAVYPLPSDFAPPQWVCGQVHYDFLNTDQIVCTQNRQGVWDVVTLQKSQDTWQLTSLSPSDTCGVHHIVCHEGKVAVLGATPYSTHTLWLWHSESQSWGILKEQQPLSHEHISRAQAVEFPTSNGESAYGFFYAPKNAFFESSSEDRPPLIVIGHGGPTSASDPSLNLKIQFWTQRGFAVFDVNYRGSTGFGRTYRTALDQQWGIVDVDDLCAAAEYATQQGWVHPQRRIIRGSSAGGYSVLCALTDHDVFNAGVSLYGIGDLETLVSDTHKFEAHYLESLVGPYPAKQEVYIARSPIHKAQHIRCPLLVFQGLQDRVVPPSQAEQMVQSVTHAGVPVAYVTYSEEGHGFRNADTIQHQLDAELAFYHRIFGLSDAPSATPLHIANWPN